MPITHAFVSAKSDGGDSTLVRPSNWNADHAADSLVVTGGTVTASTPVLNATQTWNSSGVTFTGIKLNVTNTASDAASKLIDLQIGGVTQFSVDSFGAAHIAGTIDTAVLSISAQLLMKTGTFLYWGDAFDTAIIRVSAGLLEINNGSAGTLRDLSCRTVSCTEVVGLTRNLTVIIDGGGSAITTGIKGDLEVPFDCTINRVTMLADQSGSIVVDIWKDTYTNYPPVVGDSITASDKPTITTATKSQDTTLTGWTTSVTANDILRFNVDSVTTITRLSLTLQVTMT
jgi:hypothetical protein